MVQYHRVRWPAPDTPEAAEPRPPIEDVPTPVPPEANGFNLIHGEPHWQYKPFTVTIGVSPLAGSDVIAPTPLGFMAKAIYCQNLSNSELLVPELSQVIPPGVAGYIIRCYPGIHALHVTVLVSGNTGGLVTMVPTEEPLEPKPILL